MLRWVTVTRSRTPVIDLTLTPEQQSKPLRKSRKANLPKLKLPNPTPEKHRECSSSISVIDLTRTPEQQSRQLRKAPKANLPKLKLPERSPEKQRDRSPLFSPNDSIFNDSFDQAWMHNPRMPAPMHADGSEKLKRPEKPEGHVVTRKKAERQKMHGHECPCCEKYFDALNLSPESRAKRVNLVSRHRTTYRPLRRAKTPEHFWDTDMPSTQEMIDRGYFKRCF